MTILQALIQPLLRRFFANADRGSLLLTTLTCSRETFISLRKLW
jgi:hypothetical protein